MNIESIIQQMTLEEKAALCTGADAWTTTAVDRLGVPSMRVADGPHGVRRPKEARMMEHESFPATCFPTASCLASTWNTSLIYEMGQALARECISQNVDVLLGPGANMKRSPLGGRNFEYFSEDPYLAGEMATNWINGVQSMGVGTSLKHFAVNSQEYERFCISAEVDERTLREIYLPAFEKAVVNAKPWSVMCAYNKVNGIYCSEHTQLLTKILKQEWGFEGLVVSDWGAVHDRVASLKGGLDLEMPGPKDPRVQQVIEAVQCGELHMGVVDEAVRRILRIVDMAAQTEKGEPFDLDIHHALARKIAGEGIVLLKNNGVLPLRDSQQVAVIGHAAQKAHFQGGGSSHINPTRVDMPFQELQTAAEGCEFTYALGYGETEEIDPGLIDQAAILARQSDVALLYIALPDSKESEGYDRADLDLTTQQITLIKAVAAVQPNTVVIINNGAPVVMGDWIDDVAAVLEAWMMGQAGGGAVADVLFGKVNPSGKVAETFPKKIVDTPAYLNWPGGNGEVRYGEGIFIGYRYYDKKEMPVQFPFGYGLSYTTFAYSNARVSNSVFKDIEGITVSVDVTNTGQVAGKEVVQVYVSDPQSDLVRPLKELKGFTKVEIQPGETKTVSIPLDFRAFAYYHPSYRQWITEDGDFNILIAASAADMRFVLPVMLQSTVEKVCILSMESTIRAWLDDPRGQAVIRPWMAEIKKHMNIIQEGTDTEFSTGIDLLGSLVDMPLVSVLHWRDQDLPDTPENVVADLLEQVHLL